MAPSRSDAYRFLAAAISGLPDVAPKRMFGADAFFTRHGMFAFLLDDAIVLKLSESDQARVLDEGIGRPFLVGQRAAFGRWVEIGITGHGAAARAFVLARSAHDLAQAPERDGPRRRKPVARRRKPTRSIPG
jgi:TfoX/Sxy family transcriptional regulator of competence genes